MAICKSRLHSACGHWLVAVLAPLFLLLQSPAALAQDNNKPVRIGVPTAMQLQVGRDTITAIKMAVDEVNKKGGILGRKVEFVVADETENPETGISAIRKLLANEKVDVLIGGYTSGVTLAQMPHISAAKTIYLGVGAASPSVTNKVKTDYDNYKYVFRVGPINSAHQARALVDYVSNFVIGELGYKNIAIIGENAKWVQDLVPLLSKGAKEVGAEVKLTELFDTQKVKASGAQYMIVIVSHGSSDILAKQWHDAQVPVPYGGVDVKSMDGDFFKRIGGKSISQVTVNFAVRTPLTKKTIPFFDEFKKQSPNYPVFTAFFAYDAVLLYADAVKRAGSFDTDKIIKELEKTRHEGIAGEISFDEQHDLQTGKGKYNLLFVQWQEKGERAVIYPKELRNGDFILPPWMKK
jgi:branched-chain amino acid transport system substrate-binding protein